MTQVKQPIPVQFERQYKAPLTIGDVFQTVDEMNSYLSNESRYAGMRCTCLEQEGVEFILNNNEDTWIPVSGGTTGTDTITVDSVEDLDSDIASGVYELKGGIEGLLVVDTIIEGGDLQVTQTLIRDGFILVRIYDQADFQGYGAWVDYKGNLYTKTQIDTIISNEVSARNTAISNAISALINGAPSALDTLKELADALNDDQSAIASIITALAGKVDAEAGYGLSENDFTQSWVDTILSKMSWGGIHSTHNNYSANSLVTNNTDLYVAIADIIGTNILSDTSKWKQLTNYAGAFDGNYNHLSNKPTLFSGSYTDLTDKPTMTESGTTAQTVGGIPAGTNLQGKSAIEILDTMLYPELNPTLTSPSASLSLSQSGLIEVGTVIGTLNMNATLNRGSISPQYGASSPYRSGAFDYFAYSGSNISSSNSGSTPYALSNYTVIVGSQTFSLVAYFLIGVQPKTNKGNNYSSPLAAGSVSASTQTITGVYALYATTASITTLTKQVLQAHGSDIAVTLVADSGANKQTVRIPQAWGTITVLQQYNTLSGTWDAIDLATFTKTAVMVGSVSYWEYVYNGSSIGSRQLKFKL